jgi:hypothetical protein
VVDQIGDFEAVGVIAIDDLNDEARQVIVGQPLVHRRRQHVGAVSGYGDEAAHLWWSCGCPAATVSAGINAGNAGKPDRLLVAGPARGVARDFPDRARRPID